CVSLSAVRTAVVLVIEVVVLDRVCGVVVLTVEARVCGRPSQLTLECGEVRLRAVVLELPSDLDLLRLGATATHWPDPLRAHPGRVTRGPWSVFHRFSRYRTPSPCGGPFRCAR